MGAFVARRLAQGVVIVFMVATLSFFLIHLAPGDPFTSTINNPLVTEAVRERWRAAYGLDRSLPEQYWLYLHNVVRGDFGYSFSLHQPVRQALAVAIPRTLLLMGVALLASFCVGIALGIVQAVRHGTKADQLLTGVSLFFYSMPDFWLAVMMMLVFAYWIPIFPTSGMFDPVLHDYLEFWGRIGDVALHLALPAATLTLLATGGIARFQRSAMLEVAGRDFVRVARAKGVGEGRIVLRHVLRNALLPVITLIGLALPALLGGAVFVETVFAWPGMGLLAVNAIATRDYPLVTAAVIIASVLVTLGSLLADVLYAVADPRLRA